MAFGAEPLEHELEKAAKAGRRTATLAVTRNCQRRRSVRIVVHESHERRHPLRFVWQMDAEGHFVVGSDEFIELVGPRTTAAFGRLWSEIAAELKVDPENRIARAVATRETWSGIVLSWPVEDGDERLPSSFRGLPVFRSVRGTFAAIGVLVFVAIVARINHLLHARRERPIGFMSQPEAPLEAKAANAPSPEAEAQPRRHPTEPQPRRRQMRRRPKTAPRLRQPLPRVRLARSFRRWCRTCGRERRAVSPGNAARA